MQKYVCLSCGFDEVYENKSFSWLPRVTSDSVPFPSGGTICVCLRCGLIQRMIDEKWKQEIQTIYRDYAVYPLTDGADQVLFSEGGQTRAERVLDILYPELSPDFNGSVIDIGCSNGAFLKAFHDKFPHAALYGREIDDKSLPRLRQIPNFRKLFTAQDKDIGQTFDVIASIHCFEHVFDYPGFFKELAVIRKDGARILLQVPDVDTSPFDIVVADHATHFSQATLERCLAHHFEAVSVTRLIPKELTAITAAAPGGNKKFKMAGGANFIDALDNHVGYLTRMLEFIDAQQLAEFGVYGTRIAAAWLTGRYRDKIAFYVDDDVLTQGKKFDGKPVMAPADVPKHSKVVLPFIRPTVQTILASHPNLQSSAVYYG
jgi:SAM-dependent methyltransferase